MKHSLSKKISDYVSLEVNKSRCRICYSRYSESRCLFMIFQGSIDSIHKQNIYKPSTVIPIYFNDYNMKLAKNVVSELTFLISFMCEGCGSLKTVKFPMTKITSCG